MLTYQRAAPGVLAVILYLCCSLAHAQGRLELAGLALYTDTARDIYVAGLRSADGRVPADLAALSGPLAMEYRIATRRLSARGFSGTLLLQAELGAGHRAPEGVIDLLGRLKQSMNGSLVQGDQFEILLTGAGETVFMLDGSELARGEDASAFGFLLQGWLGSSASALVRESLLSGELDDGLLLRFESLMPLNERVELVASWTGGEENVSADTAPAAVVAAASAPAAVPQPDPEPEPEPEIVAAAAAPLAEEAVEPAVEAVAGGGELAAATATSTEDAAELPPGAEAANEAEVVAVVDEAVAEESSTEPAAETGPETQGREDAVAAMDDRDYQLQLKEYLTQVLSQVFGEVRYPRRAVDRELQGKVEVLAELDAQGQLLDVSMLESSGYAMLDRAALNAVQEAAPFPQLSLVALEEFRSDDGENYVLMIPVNFRLQ